MNSFVLFFRSRVLKTFSREFNATIEISSRRDLVTIANVAISRVLLTIALNVDLSRFNIEFMNDEIVKRETKNQKYARFFAKKIAAKRIQNLICLKNRIQRNWFKFDSISKWFRNIFKLLMYHDFKHEKYLKTKVFSMYKIKFILELEEFIRACNLMFETWCLFYVIDQHKIMYAKMHIHQSIFDSKWTWNKHVKKLRVTNQIEITWIEFVNFFRKIINSIKQRIIRIEKTLFNLRQRFEQSIIQLIVYLKTLKKQWIDFIQNSVRVLFLIQTLYSYIRRELIRRQINIINRREIKKTTRNIKAIEFVSIHLKKKDDDDHKTSDFDSKRYCIQNNTFSKNVLVVALVAFVSLSRFTNDRKLDKSNKFVSKKNFFQRNREFKSAMFWNLAFACYNCENLNYFKNKCRQFIREKKVSNR